MNINIKELFFLLVFALLMFSDSYAASNGNPPPSANDLQTQVQMLQNIMQKPKQALKMPAALEQAQIAPADAPSALPASAPSKNNSTTLKGLSALTSPSVEANTGDIYEEAFNNLVNQLLPMSPEQIAHLRQAFNEAQRAAATPPGTPPRPTSASVQVDLAPQATPPIIRLQAGYITSLVFMDSTGQPWPVAAYSLGDPSAFNIQWDKKSNTLLVQSVTFYKRSNLAIILKGLNTPVMLTLLPGQEAVDYRVDLRVPGLGPNAMIMQNSLPQGANPVLIDVLNGVPPKDSKTLKASREDCQAWLAHKTLYLRTNLTIISPAWKAMMTSMDGMHAYELQASPVILALEHGKDKTITLTLDGWE